MFPSSSSSGLSLSKVLNGISKTLNIAQEFIPVYKQVAPLTKKVASIPSLIKKLNTNTPTKKNKEEIPIKKTTTESNSFNNPTFFI